jgi:hypothetical protein
LNFVRIAGLTGAATVLAGGVTVAVSSCSQTPTNVPVRTFEQAQRVDFVCMAVNDITGAPLPADKLQPLPQGNCSPVPSLSGLASPYSSATFPDHLYAVVTQTTPGTLAVVDLTNQGVVDEDNATPGINFIPVGQQPTDVVVPPDGAMTFVTSADPGKPAIYGIDNRHLLGTSTGNPTFPPLKLTDLPACALPQPPLAISTAPLAGGGYALIVMLGSSGNAGARIAAYDPAPLLRGAGVVPGAAGDAGAGEAGAADGGAGDAGPVDLPGQLTACTLLGNTLLADSTALPSSFQAGPAWPDGVPYVEGGVDLEGAAPPPAPVLDGGAGTCSAPPAPDAGLPLSVVPPAQATPSAMVLRTDNSMLYVADGQVPVIHVVDVSDPTRPTELAPLLATSVRNPAKTIRVGPLAISPPTRDYKRYLYAVDDTEGTVMVYDVTDPASSPHVPMQRPHAELNPFVEPDRLAFSAPVATVTFVEHDWLLESQVDSQHYYSGVLCNPNPNAHPTASEFLTKGAYYRVDQAGTIQNSGTVENFPSRLRGVFGFVTLSNGAIVPIDVDDWDAPCRRPDPMATGMVTDLQGQTYPTKAPPIGLTGVLDVAQKPPMNKAEFFDEYHVPIAYQSGLSEVQAVTDEAFFPVSAPNRIRSGVLLETDPNGGNNMPRVLQTPVLLDQSGSPVQVGGTVTSAPLIQPTPLPSGFVDPSLLTNPAEPNPNARVLIAGSGGDAGSPTAVPGVRVSYDDPTAHINQGWTVTYEGPLFAPVGPIDLDTTDTDKYQTLIITNGVLDTDAGPAPANGLATPGFCGMGIEDWSIGTARAQAAGLAASAAWTSDYIEIADDLLEESDPYWGETGNDCWQGTPALADGVSNVADARYTACSDRFGAQGTDAGASGTGTLADSFLSRDFPIIQAFDDHLVVGRFGWDPKSTNGEQTSNRVIVGADASNVPFLQLARCCFHHQATFKVRTGGEWVTVGQNGLGLLHHVQTGAGGACVLSCNPDDVLRNARALDLSVIQPPKSGSCNLQNLGTITSAPAPSTRNDATAMRNPMFSFYVQAASGPAPSCTTHTLAQRDMQWQFSMTGGFAPISITLNAGTAAGVSPQSMKFIEPFGQLAVVDGSQQGLVIIDLNTLGFAHSPYY